MSLDNIKSFFKKNVVQELGSEKKEPHALHLAYAILMFEISYADFDVQEEEIRSIGKILENKFQLEKEDTNWLLDIAKMRHEDTLSLYPFIKEINENFKHEEKFQILVSAWEVAYADGQLDKHEEHRIRKISDLLRMSHKDFIKSKIQVVDA